MDLSVFRVRDAAMPRGRFTIIDVEPQDGYACRMRGFYSLVFIAFLAACASEPSDKTELTQVSFAELPGWGNDQQSEALRVFAQSCPVVLNRASGYSSKAEGPVGNAANWFGACSMAQQQAAANVDDASARQFFENYFSPYKVTTERQPFGHMTGYYLPLLKGSITPDAVFRYPVYGLPRNFVKGTPQPERAQIEAGALKGIAPILLYVDDPVMLFFVHIQGSGKVQLPDGRVVTIQYAAQNGHSYVAIGRPMREAGLLQGEISMQTIRDYLYQHPAEAQGIMNMNPSYIFFTLNETESTAKGAIGLSLTPLRSVAIDDDRAAYGVPTYIATTHPNFYTQAEEPLNRLMVSQDTGGALHGPHRLDIFFGIGPDAEWAAGKQNTQGEVFWLLPR